MIIHLATDHRGFELKNILKQFIVKELGHEVVDHGADELDPVDDYPDFVHKAAAAVAAAADDSVRGIILGMSGQGEAMVANRYKGVRTMVYYGHNPELINLSREDNNSNILSLAAGFLTDNEAKAMVQRWLTAEFSGQSRHRRRIEKIDNDIIEI